MNDSKWAFKDDPDEAVVTDSEVLRGVKPILLVCHYSDGDGWAFLTGDPISNEKMMIVSLKKITEIDSSLSEIANLQEGWSASRSLVGGEWKIFEDKDL